MDSEGRKNVKATYKSWFDISDLILSGVLLLPMWVILWTGISLAIWIGDRGPVYYRQQRMGKDGKPFNLIKFRTMVVNADDQGPGWTTEGDPRITRVGQILRRTALDELPELISIAQGNMSFVGPRALELDEHRSLEELMPGFERRLQIRPGLTGLAPIYDKSDDPYEKYKYDIEYLQRLSPLLDARLLLRSVWYTVISG
jgi:lipopolysaccharide/colanic/teichoic acid biosynthesis glycosyltransferase